MVTSCLNPVLDSSCGEVSFRIGSMALSTPALCSCYVYGLHQTGTFSYTTLVSLSGSDPSRPPSLGIMNLYKVRPFFLG